MSEVKISESARDIIIGVLFLLLALCLFIIDNSVLWALMGIVGILFLIQSISDSTELDGKL